jgi:GNAT superfamily N-acetyltransferase
MLHAARRRQPLVLTADRGRGKSSLLGLAAARLLDAGYRVLLTAPSPAAAARALEHSGQRLPFMAPDALLARRPEADLLLVDEAAAIPSAMLLTLARRYCCLFASTEHGYEGTGLGFQLKFQPALARLSPGWRKYHLSEPARWSPRDPLEPLVFRLLALDADPVTPPAGGELRIHRLEPRQLIEDESLLRQLFGLLTLAHYQTRPSDLRQLLDAPGLELVLARLGGIPVAAALLVREGELDPALGQAIWEGRRRPRGHLLPQSLAFHGGFREACRLSYRRIMRIVVHPRCQQQGIGSRLLDWLKRQGGADFLGTSFGASPELPPFNALMTALSATIGTGNIAGVATAIAIGGPGALFWMWMTALVGMGTKYAETVLAMRYREVDEAGNHLGGPMYYIKHGLGPKWLWMAAAFALFGVLAGFGIGNTVQANSVADAVHKSMGVPEWVTGVVMAVLAGLVLIGGIRRIGEVAGKLVPFMALAYLGGGLIILACTLGEIPAALVMIVESAFTGTAAGAASPGPPCGRRSSSAWPGGLLQRSRAGQRAHRPRGRPIQRPGGPGHGGHDRHLHRHPDHLHHHRAGDRGLRGLGLGSERGGSRPRPSSRPSGRRIPPDRRRAHPVRLHHHPGLERLQRALRRVPVRHPGGAAVPDHLGAGDSRRRRRSARLHLAGGGYPQRPDGNPQPDRPAPAEPGGIPADPCLLRQVVK